MSFLVFITEQNLAEILAVACRTLSPLKNTQNTP